MKNNFPLTFPNVSDSLPVPATNIVEEFDMTTATTVADTTEFDRICAEFVADYTAGKKPTIEQYCKRYPRYTGQLVDFILKYVTKVNRATRRREKKVALIALDEVIESLMADKSA